MPSLKAPCISKKENKQPLLRPLSISFSYEMNTEDLFGSPTEEEEELLPITNNIKTQPIKVGKMYPKFLISLRNSINI